MRHGKTRSRENTKARLVSILILTIICIAMGSLSSIDAQSPSPGWNEVIRTPGGSYGARTLGRWAYITNYGFGGPGCTYQEYRPTTGAHAYWWTEGYDDSAWSSTGYVVWNDTWPIWGFDPLPQIGNYAWNGTTPCCGTGWTDADFQPNSTALHRRQFTVSGSYLVQTARLSIFSDNVSAYYINGHRVTDYGNIPGSWFHSGTNVLAVQLSNDCTPNNMMGLQYILDVHYADPPTWNGTVSNRDTGLGVGGIPVAFTGEYEVCGAPGTYAPMNLGAVTTAADGTYTLALNPLPPCSAASGCCGWQFLHIAENLPWDTLYRPASAAAPAPGSVQSATHIRYPWQQTGTFNGNDFLLEFIPISTTLTVDYSHLVLHGPELPPPGGPLPAQVLRGAYTGPLPLGGRAVDVHVWDGSTWTAHATFTDAAGNYMIDAGLIGEPLFGTTDLGLWQAYAEITVPGRGLFISSDAFWSVQWFPVHGTK